MANSRAEAIIEATLNGEVWDGIPQSRMEKLLLQLNGGGGSGSVVDFSQITNRPTINGNEIDGELDNDILELIEPLTEEDRSEVSNLIEDDEE